MDTLLIMNKFTEHPASVNESYCQHLRAASTFAYKLLVASMVCFIHAFLPFLFEKKGSQIVLDLHQSMLEKRIKN